ncbi:unnamed protein product [Periconia digitata]|uniref:Uncharacterized protein n=1 Tax=Periconia digitata TaxID=1303443 RepID=A0A9W4UC21_9PLEO|nr:unnamed protein product [Periconia digitata]
MTATATHARERDREIERFGPNHGPFFFSFFAPFWDVWTAAAAPVSCSRPRVGIRCLHRHTLRRLDATRYYLIFPFHEIGEL